MADDLTFDPTLREIVSPEIRHGEKVLWIGKPTPLRVLTQQYAEEVISAILIIVAAIFISTVTSFDLTSFEYGYGGGGFVFPLFGLIFIAVLGFSLLRPIYAFWQATKTIYAVTDYRALILKPTFGSMSVTSYPNVERIERRRLTGDKGDLIFATETYSARGRYGYRTRRRKVGFYGIPNARRVEDLLLENIPGAQYPKFNN